MARLPVPRSDEGNWGHILNDFLRQVHAEDGRLKSNVVTAVQLATGSVTAPSIQDSSIGESKLSTELRAKLDSLSSASDGREIELRATANYIQWRYVGGAELDWVDLVELSQLQGPEGDKGEEGLQGPKGDPGTTDYNELINRPTLGTAAATNATDYATSNHSHPLTDLQATGTASETTYLRGDGTWSTPGQGEQGVPGPPGNPTEWELRGTGSPEGVVTASPGTYYTDTLGTLGAWRWLKTAGAGTTGWTVIYGVATGVRWTGWRDITTLAPNHVSGKLLLARWGDGRVAYRFHALTLSAAGFLYEPVGFRYDRGGLGDGDDDRYPEGIFVSRSGNNPDPPYRIGQVNRFAGARLQLYQITKASGIWECWTLDPMPSSSALPGTEYTPPNY